MFKTLLSKISLPLIIALFVSFLGVFWMIHRPLYKELPTTKVYSASGKIIEFTALMYHRVDHWQAEDDSTTRSLKVAPDEFENQLKRYRNQGYTTISIAALVEAIQHNSDLPQKSLLITFDDGFIDNYLYAFPLLKKYEMVGSFAIITRAIGQPAFATLDQLKEMAAAGMSIMSHTMSHCNLVMNKQEKYFHKDAYFLDPELDELPRPCDRLYDFSFLSRGQIGYELEESKKQLATQIGVDIAGVVYPIGAFSSPVLRLAQKAGYAIGFTTESPGGGVETNSLALPRVRIKGIPQYYEK